MAVENGPLPVPGEAVRGGATRRGSRDSPRGRDGAAERLEDPQETPGWGATRGGWCETIGDGGGARPRSHGRGESAAGRPVTGSSRLGVSRGRTWSLHASRLSAPDSCALTARAAVGWIALESSAWRSGWGAGWNGSGSGEPLGHLGRTQVRFTAGVEGVPVSGDEAAEEGGRETPSPDRVWVAPGRGVVNRPPAASASPPHSQT